MTTVTDIFISNITSAIIMTLMTDHITANSCCNS